MSKAFRRFEILLPLRFNDGQRDHVRMLDGICGHEGKPETGGDHGHGPIVAFTPIRRRASYALILKYVVSVTGEFAVHPMYVALAVEFLDGKSTFVGELMVLMNGDDHLLTKERHNVSSLVGFFAWQRVNNGLQITGKQPIGALVISSGRLPRGLPPARTPAPI